MQAGTENMRKIGSITLLDVEEVSKKLGITTKTVVKLINDGELPARKLGKSWFVSDRKLQEFVETPENMKDDRASLALALVEELEECNAVISIEADDGAAVPFHLKAGELVPLDEDGDEEEEEDSEESDDVEED